jgi:hypothetical protein
MPTPAPTKQRSSTSPTSASQPTLNPDPTRNLFPDEPLDFDPDVDGPDPFDDDLDLSNESSIARPLDAIKFLLQHFRIDQLDPELFLRLKSRVFTIPHAVEQLIKEDAYFASMLRQFYAALSKESGLDLRAALEDFKSDAVLNLTSVAELVDLVSIYCVYRTKNLSDDVVPDFLVTQSQEVIELAFRTARSRLLQLVQQCTEGSARCDNPELLSGASLVDSPGEIFILSPAIRPKFVKILGICHSLYLTSNCALLADISVLLSRLLVGSADTHALKQRTAGAVLERIEVWLSRRVSCVRDLESACVMLDLFQEMPGNNTMISDALDHALHPVFVKILRSVIRLNGVPRNLLSWGDFERLLSDTQLQIDADPAFVSEALALHVKQHAVATPVVAAVPTPAPQGLVPSALMLSHEKDHLAQVKEAEKLIDLSTLPKAGSSFPKTPEDCSDCVIDCLDCPQKFLFSAGNQRFYLKNIISQDGTGPHFPVRCDPCRRIKKQRLAAMPLAVDLSAADDQLGWSENLEEDDYSFCNL